MSSSETIDNELETPEAARSLHRRIQNSPAGFLLGQLELSVFRVFQLVVQSLPEEEASRFGKHLGSVAHRILRRQRNICHTNLKLAADRPPSEEQLEKLTKGVFRHLGKALSEFVWLQPRLQNGGWKQYISVHGIEQLNEYDGAVIASLHLGNWEYIGQVLALHDFPIYSVSRRHRGDSPLINLLQDWRTANGQKIILEDAESDKMLRVLQNGKFLGLVADQYAKDSGIFMKFFGTTTTHHPGPAILSRRAGVPLVPAYCYRDPRGLHYSVVFDEPVYHPDREESPDTEEVIRRLFRKFETYIRSHTEQWVWIHRKWRLKWLAPEEKEPLR